MELRPTVLLTAAAVAGAVFSSTGTSRPTAAPPLHVRATAPSSSGPARGTVAGTVLLDVGRASEPPSLGPYSRRRYRPPSRASASAASPRDVVVFVAVDGASPTRSDSTARIVQRDRTILPHVTAIQAGTTVTFPNQDDVYHNLFSLSEPHPFNLGRYPPGESRSQLFERPGVIRMFCDIHSEMTGVIRVLDTPWFTRPEADGSFRIPDVPAGTHRVVAWHESAGADTVIVEVRPDSVARVDLRVAE